MDLVAFEKKKKTKFQKEHLCLMVSNRASTSKSRQWRNYKHFAVFSYLLYMSNLNNYLNEK